MKKLLGRLSVLGVLLAISSSAFSLNVTLHLNKDTVSTYSRLVHACSFNPSATFELRNEIIYLDVNETLDLEVINHDSLVHTFTIDGFISSPINPGATAQLNVSFPNAGSYRFYSAETYGKLAGASGLIVVGHVNYTRYGWNLFEMTSSLTSAIVSDSIQAIPNDAEPDLFFINGSYFPNTMNDPDGHVQATVGDTVIIGILNSGDMEHVLHFHGFHVDILQASVSTNMVDWIKDTLPLKVGETMTVRLVVDQAGEYPVHDHNLIAVTNAGLYPGGMITRLSVAP